MNADSIAIRPILLEAFFVVLGVVLALAANEWRQNRHEETRTQTAAASINEEIRINQEMVASSLEYHVRIAESLRRAVERPDMSLFSKGFTYPTELLTTSYDLAVSTDAIGNMDYATALAYSRIYDKYEAYKHQQQIVGRIIYETMFESGVDGVVDNYKNLGIILSTFFFKECVLLAVVNEHVPTMNNEQEFELVAIPPMCDIVMR